MARPSGENKREVTAYVPERIMLEVELLLPRDTLTRKIKHGALSQYITMLIANDLRSRAGNKENIHAN